MLTPEQRYRIELAKDRTPSTGGFLLWIPVFVILAVLGRSELPKEVRIQPEPVSVPITEVTVLGWRLM